jgi:serine/threonine-protein kinase
VEQNPRAGSPVKHGAEVQIVLSLGKQVAEVPNLRGHTLQSAEVNLRAAGLSAGRIARVFSGSGQADRVVRQSPAAGSQVDHGRSVDLFISLERSPESFVMPDLVYRSYDRVREYFESQGFRLGSVKYEPYEGIDPGVVLRQFPLAGHRVARRDVISLVVASIPQEVGG